MLMQGNSNGECNKRVNLQRFTTKQSWKLILESVTDADDNFSDELKQNTVQFWKTVEMSCCEGNAYVSDLKCEQKYEQLKIMNDLFKKIWWENIPIISDGDDLNIIATEYESKSGIEEKRFGWKHLMW